MTCTTLSIGRFTANKVDSDLRPRICPARTPVIYCHSAAMDGSEALGLAQLPSVGPIMRRLAQDRIVAAPTLDTLWGNATSMARITAAVTWVRANGASSSKVVIIGSSMGSTAALTWALNNPADCAAVVAFLPAVDLEAIRTADTGGLRASIDVAYGVTYPASLPAGANPAQNTGLGVPVQLWYASNDAVSANIAAYGAATSADMHNVGALSHTDAAVAAVDIPTVAAFVLANST